MRAQRSARQAALLIPMMGFIGTCGRLLLTAPIGAYLVSKAALHLRLKAGKAELPPRG
ncbi:MAG: hypothetical protein JKY37_20580 [Nannocystaceae bacterium]|nr:hypothetical protein [Nannocystaceae bacterium]